MRTRAAEVELINQLVSRRLRGVAGLGGERDVEEGETENGEIKIEFREHLQ